MGSIENEDDRAPDRTSTMIATAVATSDDEVETSIRSPRTNDEAVVSDTTPADTARRATAGAVDGPGRRLVIPPSPLLPVYTFVEGWNQ